MGGFCIPFKAIPFKRGYLTTRISVSAGDPFQASRFGWLLEARLAPETAAVAGTEAAAVWEEMKETKGDPGDRFLRRFPAEPPPCLVDRPR